MAVTSSEPAPYAPAKAVLELVARFRNKGLPTPISLEVLGRSGITDSLIPRTFQALKTLDLIDDTGVPTPTFEALRMAPEPDYKQRLCEWLNDTYADVLKFVNPSTSDETALRDAFRSYKPFGQQDRMVSLFIGLYAAAGVTSEKTTSRKTEGAPSRTTSSTNKGTRRGVPNVADRAQAYSGQETPAGSSTARTSVYDVLLGIWKPGKMPKEVDDAVITLLRWLKEQE